MGQSRIPKIRRDGWTSARQLAFLAALARTRSVTRAAAFADMSRESAYRLRERPQGALFAALWDQALQFDAGPESHNPELTDGRLMRLLGNHFRWERGDFDRIGSANRKSLNPDRSGIL